MNDKYLHVITFDTPFPPNYGGAIDVFYRLKEFQKNGVKVILHAFLYERPVDDELNEFCDKVYYYQRDMRFINHMRLTPFSVVSRRDPELLENLKKDNYPILFEGLISCSFISHPDIANRRKYFREANIEHLYYYNIAKASKNIFKKTYSFVEAIKLYFFEKKLKNSDTILAISSTDAHYLQKKIKSVPVEFIACFHPNEEITIQAGQSDYILYHANLSVPENSKVAIYLIKNVFSKIKHKCIIAGMNPPLYLQKLVSSFDNIELIANPNKKEMEDLIQNAQIITLITFQATGMKIKLLESLFSAKHIIANDKMVQGSGLDALCHLAETADEITQHINNLITIPFSEKEINSRADKLLPNYSNSTLISQILRVIDL